MHNNSLRERLLATTRMTPIEHQAGRFLRAPDHDADDGFEMSPSLAAQDAQEKAADGKGAKKPVENTGGDEPGDDDDPDGDADKGGDDDNPDSDADKGEEGDGEPEEKPKKPKKPASERIRELNNRARQAERRNDELEARLAALEKGLPAGEGDGNKGSEREKPDPKDLEKYPLGALDDRYIEDMIDYAAEKKAAEKVDAVLQRQEQSDQQAAAERQMAELRAKADDLTTKGGELYDDFQETVVDAGLAGDWDLTQVTFEAAAEAEHGAQILYDLASDPKEATRVAQLSPFGQLKFIRERNDEIAAGSQPRRKPRADPPPGSQPRGNSSKTEIRDDTDNLDDFEKRWNENERKRR